MTNAADAILILVLGEPNTGKSHYAYQLFGRLRQGGCEAELRESPENIQFFENGLTQLKKGLAATHTSTNTYLEAVLPLSISGIDVDLRWPDHGGEPLFQQLTQRRVTQSWADRLNSSDAWLLFLRLGPALRPKDNLANPMASEIGSADETPNEINSHDRVDDLSEQGKIIELLQILLHVRRIDTSWPVTRPVLGIMMSCWDELETSKDDKPESFLRGFAPLIHQFITANWAERSHFIVGLSSVGKVLSEEVPDSEFVARGPEQFGFSVTADGERTIDLTMPITLLLKLAHSPES